MDDKIGDYLFKFYLNFVSSFASIPKTKQISKQHFFLISSTLVKC